jgi:hypothetical protein
MEFHSHADAKAAKELLTEQFSEEITLRPKHQHPSDGNVANWRMTHILRAELGNRTFGREEVDAVLIAHNYLGKSSRSWLVTAKHGVIDRLRRGEYRFKQKACNDYLAKCLACQPEPLQCTAV